MTNRPYFSFKVSELSALVEASSSDQQLLAKVLVELAFRKTRASKRLKVRVEECLEARLRPPSRSEGKQSSLPVASVKVRSKPIPISQPVSDTPSVPKISALPRTPIVSPQQQAKPLPPAGNDDSVARDDQTSKQSQFRPWFWGRLFGRRPTLISRNRNEIQILHRNVSFEISISEIRKLQVEQGVMSNSIVLVKAGVGASSIRFTGIASDEKERLQHCLFECRFGRVIREAHAEFMALLEQAGYVTYRAVHRWADCHQAAISAINQLQGKGARHIEEWRAIAASWESQIKRRNDSYVDKLAIEWRSFFDRLESNPLTSRQVEAILRDDDYTLVVAGAGTGKTSAVVGKIGFLVESGEARPDEILALAYGRDAAQEMRDRVAERTGHEVDIRTFHALGLFITQKGTGNRQHIADTASDARAFNALIARLLASLFDDEETKGLVLDFVVNHRYPAKYLEDFDGQGNYFVYLRKHEPRTLRGELVKSFEELLIADWLILNGVNYEYEHPYEFKTASRRRRQYKPDFYLVDYGIYLEHFGIGVNGNTAPGIDKESYNQGIEWKRSLHKINGTKMLETYSWERQQGTLLEKLKQKLLSAGVAVTPMDSKQMGDLIRQREVSEPLVELLQRFLTIFREGMWTEKEILARTSGLEGVDLKRANSFLQLFFVLSKRYKTRLSDRQEVDFSDMISQAVGLLEEAKVRMPFKRIVVDEYQDISRGRQRLLKALQKQTDDTRIMCVGDDWQSIYGFTGSDIRMTTEFDTHFGPCTRVDLDQTFRFTQPIMESSARFIQKNERQLRKRISARTPELQNSIEIVSFSSDHPETIQKILSRFDAKRPARERWSVLLLGRYNRLESDDLESVSSRFPMLDVQFMTIHKSKGLEADAVAVLELKAARYGFPSEIENDKLLELVLPADESYSHAEERRVLYVAMTRARSMVLLVVDPHSASEFVEELQVYPEVHTDAQAIVGRFSCPDCKRGRLELTNPNRVNGFAWKCTLRPYCTNRAKFCSTCTVAPADPEGESCSTCQNSGKSETG